MKKFFALLFSIFLLNTLLVLCIMKVGNFIHANDSAKNTSNQITTEENDTRNDDLKGSTKDTDLPCIFVYDESVLDQNEGTKVNIGSIETNLNEYGLELTIVGATGFASIDMPLYLDLSKEAVSKNISKGTAFTIYEENGDMWLVKVDDETYGWIENKYCLINLPDVIPSIIYDNTNSYSSMYRSVGNDLEGITNNALYNSLAYNERFSENMFIVPALYGMSKKICLAQHEALKDGNTLKIYEAFRAYDTQMAVCEALKNLVKTNKDVAYHVNNNTWGIGWFIATGVSNHQRGYAMDVSLAKVVDAREKYCGTYKYICINDYDEYMMPTKMHELSDLSVALSYPVNSLSRTEWTKVKLASSMNEFAKLLQNYCTKVGLTPLASEWWHFNDLDAKDSVGDKLSDGKFYVTESKSEIPTIQNDG